jgi:hypothetical protein
MFETDTYLKPTSKLEVEAYVPAGRRGNVLVAVPLVARVVWTNEIAGVNRKAEGNNRYRVGMEFLDIEKEHCSIVADFVNRRSA